MILSLLFSQATPLHCSAMEGRLETCRLLVESKADVAATDGCFSPPPSHHLSLTICLAAGALHSNTPSNSTKPASLHTCAASARRNDALPRLIIIITTTIIINIAFTITTTECYHHHHRIAGVFANLSKQWSFIQLWNGPRMLPPLLQ